MLQRICAAQPLRVAGPAANEPKRIAQAEFDEATDAFHREVVNTRDSITFQGRSVAELKTAFRDSIDDYLAWCAERRETPEKPYSGRFVLRLSPDLHRDLALEASRRHISLNTLIVEHLAHEPQPA